MRSVVVADFSCGGSPSRPQASYTMRGHALRIDVEPIHHQHEPILRHAYPSDWHDIQSLRHPRLQIAPVRPLAGDLLITYVEDIPQSISSSGRGRGCGVVEYRRASAPASDAAVGINSALEGSELE